jgi:hypothetical protein
MKKSIAYCCSICGESKRWLCQLPVKGNFFICGNCATLINAGKEADAKYLEKNASANVIRQMIPEKQEVLEKQEVVEDGKEVVA